MHTRGMAEHEGEFDAATRVDRPCTKCGARDRVTVQAWESKDGAYEDNKYTCHACGHVWWVEGIDS